MRFQDKEPIYTLPHGIEVIGEYPAKGVNRYCRVRIRAHRFFAHHKATSRGILVRRSRVVMASVLGRALQPNEHVHHKNENRSDDRPENLELLSAAEHNGHHKTGSKHSLAARKKISEGLKLAITEGRREPPPHVDWTGRRHSEASKKKSSETKLRLIAEGKIKPTPPPTKRGEENPKAKLTGLSVIAIRARVELGETRSSLAKEFGICVQSVCNIVNRKTWSHI